MSDIDSFFNELFYQTSSPNLGINSHEILNLDMFYPFGYTESDRSRILNKLHVLRDTISDVNLVHYKFVILCIQKVESDFGLTETCIDFLNKLYELYHRQ